MFEDPCGLFDFELPIGWEYDVETPELERLSFVRWDRPQETLSLSALSPFAPSGSSLIEWRKAAEHIAPEPALRPPLTQAVGRRGVRAQRTRRQQSG